MNGRSDRAGAAAEMASDDVEVSEDDTEPPHDLHAL